MSCKSALYAANENDQAFAATGTSVNFGNVVRRFGQNCNLSGGQVVVMGTGYYDIDVNVVFTGAAGTVTVQLYKDGTAITGATASLAIATGSTASISVPMIIRQMCCRESEITAVISGVVGTVTNAAIVVEKI